jgi:hypothetical protein
MKKTTITREIIAEREATHVNGSAARDLAGMQAHMNFTAYDSCRKERDFCQKDKNSVKSGLNGASVPRSGTAE